MSLEQVLEKIKKQDMLSTLLRKTAKKGRSIGFGAPDVDPIAEKLLSIDGDATEIQVGETFKTVTPRVDMILVGDQIIFTSHNITEGQLRSILDSRQKSAMTRAMSGDLQNKIKKLNVTKS